MIALDQFMPILMGGLMAALVAVIGALYVRIVGSLDHVAERLAEVSIIIAHHDEKHSHTEKRIDRLEGEYT